METVAEAVAHLESIADHLDVEYIADVTESTEQEHKPHGWEWSMSTSHYDRTIHEEVTFVRGEDISELIVAARAYVNDPDARWAVDEGGIMFTRPMGERLTGRENNDHEPKDQEP